MNRWRTGLLAALGLVPLLTQPAAAHHSFDAEYDSKKPVTITGYVTKVDWVNPHAFVFIETRDEDGTARTFRVEMGPPYALVRSGWKKDTVKIGDKVTVEGAALAKDGSHAAGSMQTTSMILASGQRMVMR
jgi:DNA/RNA endonuclease YhcR with UshA esterase domain